MNQSLIGWCATLTALLGAALIALRSSSWSKWGFVAFLASNLLWISWGIHCEAWELVSQNVGFLITSVSGIVTWFGWLSKVRELKSRKWLARVRLNMHLKWQSYCLRRSLLRTNSSV